MGPIKRDGSPRFRFFRTDTRAGHGILHLWLKVDVDDDWRADLRLAIQGNRFVVSEVRLFPRPEVDSPAGDSWPEAETSGVHAKVPAGGLTARLLRRVPLQVHERMLYPLHAVDLLLDGKGEPLSRQPGPQSPRRGRPPIPDEELLEVARVYETAFRAGQNPTQAVATQFPEMSDARARDLVHRARQRNFLTEANWGRAGGSLTPEARELVRKRDRTMRRRDGKKK